MKIKVNEEKRSNSSLPINEIRSKRSENITNKNLKTSSKEWLKRHINDRFVNQAKKDGYISRAAYKLIEINKKFNILRNGKVKILDLGAAPGSWSQCVAELCPNLDSLVMVDLLPLRCRINHPKAHFIEGDFTEPEIQQEILSQISGSKFDIILSDIAPNISGIRAHDAIVMEGILESVMDFALKNLADGGFLIAKCFHESMSSGEIQKCAKTNFTITKLFKPEASRQSSSEIYLVCKR